MQRPAESEYRQKQIVLGLVTVFLVYFIASYFIQTIGVARPRMAADLDGMALYSWAISIPGLGAAFVALVVQFAVPKRLLGVVTGALFFTVTMGMTIAPAVLGSVMNVAYAGSLERSLPAALSRVADDATMTSIGNPRVLLSKPAMQALKEKLGKRNSEGQALFEQTIQAIRTSMEAGLRMVFLVAAGTMLLSFLLILTLPEISMDVEVKDKKIPERVAELQPATAEDSALE